MSLTPQRNEAASLQGDAEAARARLEVAVRTNFALVWRLLRRLGVPPHSVDDAAQQVFLIAASRGAEIVAGSERAFLCASAVRVASNARRVERRARQTTTEVDADLQRSPLPGADVLADQKRAREILDAVLEELEDDLRTVLVLFELEGMTTAEIAEIAGIPVGTAASRLRRAREEFQRLVKARGYGGSR